MNVRTPSTSVLGAKRVGKPERRQRREPNMRKQAVRAIAHLARPLEWICLRSLKLLYRLFFLSMLHDESWQEQLFALIPPKVGDRILEFGPGSAWTAVSLAARFPDANIVGVDPDPKTVDKANRLIARRKIRNVAVIESPHPSRLPLSAGSFDKSICLLTFHRHSPEEKLVLAKESLRVLRRGGALYVADYDKPANREERILLGIAAYVSKKRTAVQSHVDGSWARYLKDAGFAGVRRRASCSVTIGRVTMITARRP